MKMMNSETLWRVDCDLAVVDVETTGLDPTTDRVIEIGVIHMRNGEVIDRYQSLVNPGQEIPDEVVKITGIKSEDVVDAPRFETIAQAVLDRLVGKVFVAYNLAFDRAFVSQELTRAGLAFPELIPLDPLVFVRELHRKQGSKRLGSVAERLGIPLENAHRAADDAEVAGRVLYALADQLPERLGDLRMLQEQWETQQKNEMAGWRRSRGGASSAIDQSVSGDMKVDRGNALGPAYIYGEETDPVRAMFMHLPDSGGRR